MSSAATYSASCQTTVVINRSEEDQSTQVWIPSKQQKPYQCGLCCVMFDINIELVYHVKKHSLTKPFQCGYCQVSYDTNAELTLHHGKAHLRALVVIKPKPQNIPSVFSPRDGQEGCLLSSSTKQSASTSSECNSTTTRAANLGVKNIKADNDVNTNSSAVSLGGMREYVSTSDCDVGPSCGDIKSETVDMPDQKQHYHGKPNVPFEFEEDREISKVRKTKGKIRIASICQIVNSSVPGTIPAIASMCQTTKSSVPGTIPALASICQTTKSSVPGTIPAIASICQTVNSSVPGTIPAIASICQTTKSSVPGTIPAIASICQTTKSSVPGTIPANSASATKNETCFKCPCCEKVLNAKTTLRIHMDTVHPDEKLFVCTACSIGFNHHKTYQEHMACVHSDVKRFVCSLCPAELKTKVRLSGHMREKHSLKRHQCADCKQCFKFKCDLRKHWCTPRKCSLCDTMLSTKVTYRMHMMRKHGTETDLVKKTPSIEQEGFAAHQCSECKRCYKYKYDLKQHWCEPRKCSICDIMLTSKLTYKIHMRRQHTAEADTVKKMLQCAECKRSYKYKYDLNQHLCKPRKCSVCDKMLSSKVTYKAHMMLIHGTQMDPGNRNLSTEKPVKNDSGTEKSLHQCAECGRCFRKHCDLSQHWCKPRKCSVCDKMLISSRTYELHMLRKHTTAHEKTFQCSHCHKVFAFKQDLAQHSRTHADVKPYICEFCGKSYGTSDGLKYHRNSKHLNSTPYKCKLCPKAFSCRPLQDMHERRHVGDKRYSCDQCGKKFIASGSMRRHALTHTDLRAYVCEVCSKTYRSTSALSYHLKNFHHI